MLNYLQYKTSIPQQSIIQYFLVFIPSFNHRSSAITALTYSARVGMTSRTSRRTLGHTLGGLQSAGRISLLTASEGPLMKTTSLILNEDTFGSLSKIGVKGRKISREPTLLLHPKNEIGYLTSSGGYILSDLQTSSERYCTDVLMPVT